MTPRNKVLRIVFYLVTAAMALFVGMAFFLPKEVKVSRSGVVQAPRETVYQALAALKRWPEWGPWFRRDAFIETKFDGEPLGTGAMMTWKGESVGEGRAKIVNVAPSSLKMAVRFGEGTAAQQPGGSLLDDLGVGKDGRDADLVIEMKDVPAGTEVTFHFRIDFGQNMARRYFGLSIPRMAERDFDECLANLNALLAAAKAP
jgi:Polyketide cyclase / dehydrase and lipid transport